ncbi:MAG TPA: 50S ribosomal protein L22 [Candidatus Omnitrophota bacterium]|nr:50S ribosomal protein L22 [Candidatus Omnitrophota bacterium]HOX09801.1 50S ribosomal protein L22 [Candidatus Omnitrophota bacterium]HPN66711.1 50S ribosomal protein L22 [Candidatus Omnitrophota bacterium]HRZ67531.1 50S ribosomal protein L22 [Candidatus Omnitrophota bacterium]
MPSVGRVVAKYIKISPYKMRKVMDLVRGKDVDSALAILENTDKKSGVYLVRALKSAIASAKQGGKLKQDELFVAKITADDGPMMRRFREAAMGRATMIRKRTTHIIIELGAKAKSASAKPKAVKK